MAIDGIGACFGSDVSKDFTTHNYIGIGWDITCAPELFQCMQTLKVGDIVYIKSFPPSSTDLIIKGIGIIKDDQIISNSAIECGRNVIWKNTNVLRFPKPQEKDNVRANTMYEEFHPAVQGFIIHNL